ncbi:carbohydrate ABC transporter ATP-binding protein (CUT1 family) [Chromohalobacter marismortui]|uniref:Carbohydrate ABC transporter ATP-binding protein (CUT1 family) n=1 Tax=Chromohalobacter marismortui TaxID=42055 RepID=A0A4R7NQW9_9GAMM|nr:MULTISPECIES: ABC transporter ATP-binding protein [Chromohalobacter]MCI0508724.1 ABC transporter ATP-binding protein [Chromohalobacter sp.]MCI0594631.1 ABC transporter ATP-binding protein [Chromohalobacter sp.]TDU22911.1 carbohydrate ABC transporter ATP-binding protein (CUT1 family) [Chromohalobacter marismortui]
MAEITLKSLAHTYLADPTSSEDYAIREMDHVWHQGGAYALLGPSGCGKSTLLNIISGLLEPSSGEVLFDGELVNDMPPEARNIAQVFQFPVVYDTMTVYDNLAFPLRNVKTPEARVHERVMEVADVLELTAQLKRKAKNLTADEKQKVSMGRGLVRDDVAAILFDEPLTVIDPQLKWKLRRKLKEIHQRFGVTMIYVTHDQLEASTFADKIAVMYEGQIVQFGTPRELFEEPRHTFVGYFIGSPGMNFLDVVMSDGRVMSGDAELVVGQHICDAVAHADSSNIKLGIRPEFIEVHPEPIEGGMEARVDYAQDLGTFSIVHLMLGNVVLKARIAEDQATPSSKAWLRFPDDRLGLYIDEYRVESGHE